jgi:lambda family phage minor tail protein L
MTNTLQAAAQSSAIGEIVELFTLDASDVGGEFYRFTPSTRDGAVIAYQGHSYLPVPVEAKGFEWNGRGGLPTPTLRVSNVGSLFTPLLVSIGDLAGATVTRLRTLGRFLDGQPEADPDAHWPLEVWRIERKAKHSRELIEWSLAASIDQQGQMLPGRQILRDVCTHSYRVWDGTAFDYSRATCPYTGSACFGADNSAAPSAGDRCSKNLSACKARFGSAALPTRAFPGMMRTR